jgi:hypothetical protein
MGVSHNDESQRALPGQQPLDPLGLPGSGVCQLGFVDGVVPQQRAQRIHHPEAQVRVEQAIYRRGGAMLDQAVNQSGLPPWFGEPIAVNGGHGSPADGEGRAAGLEAESQVAFPEMRVPPVMVSPDHYDRHAAPQSRQGRGNMEAPPGNDPGVREPEVEEIAVDEQTIAQTGHGVEEREERLFHLRRRDTQMGV